RRGQIGIIWCFPKNVWRGRRALTRPGLQALKNDRDEAVKRSADGTDLVFKVLQKVGSKVAELFGDDEQGMQLGQAAPSDAKVMQEFTGVKPRLAFGDVGRHGDGRAADLVGEREALVDGKAVHDGVNIRDERDAFPPDEQVFVSAFAHDHLLGKVRKNDSAHVILSVTTITGRQVYFWWLVCWPSGVSIRNTRPSPPA